ncbi:MULTISPECIES: hypothetical protein [Campylobacter]|uniref:Acyl carrier protein n=1 Tax=Campylobacter vicugnae TaxID=1660076 RepID=A0A1X9T283_9BACT|nr:MULTISPECIES: hypothetical protein [unclassified Campylobacter]ARR02585.1 hypothetical protein CVIC8964_1192 [Campylobacter sp. RM8964]MBO5063570.1 hypothetical protein [Campylobacter sp.]MBQ3167741.1 hypothetical protein [Campylobacter sp.]MBQ7135898.1 hypothetical protein [Campylobacter sp.]
METKIAKFKETIECDEPITDQTMLDSLLEWDSMGKISTIVMLADEYGHTLTYDELKNLKQVKDILDLMNE